MAKTLPMPSEIETDGKASEVLRAFVDGKGRLIIIHSVGCFESPGVWGILLADLARHISDARNGMRKLRCALKPQTWHVKSACRMPFGKRADGVESMLRAEGG